MSSIQYGVKIEGPAAVISNVPEGSALDSLKALQTVEQLRFEKGVVEDISLVVEELNHGSISEIGEYNQFLEGIGGVLFSWFGYKSTYQKVIDAYDIVLMKVNEGQYRDEERSRGIYRFFKVNPIEDVNCRCPNIERASRDEPALPSLMNLKRTLLEKFVFNGSDNVESVADDLKERSIEQISPARAFFDRLGSILFERFGFKTTLQTINESYDEMEKFGFDNYQILKS